MKLKHINQSHTVPPELFCEKGGNKRELDGTNGNSGGKGMGATRDKDWESKCQKQQDLVTIVTHVCAHLRVLVVLKVFKDRTPIMPVNLLQCSQV